MHPSIPSSAHQIIPGSLSFFPVTREPYIIENDLFKDAGFPVFIVSGCGSVHST
jgi:hypothetical protein